jgi:hypothetical protein
MNALQRAGIRSDVAFVGTSLVRRGIDANEVERLTPGVKWAHNVALPGAQTPIVERWMLEEVIPRLHPRQVVWGVSSLDFNSGRPDHPIDDYNGARATEQGAYADLDRVLQSSALSEHRDALRDPLTLERAAEGHATTHDSGLPLKDRAIWKLGYAKATPARIQRAKANHLHTLRTKQLVNFTVGKREHDAFVATITAMRRQGIDVVVVIMPVTSVYIGAHPGGSKQFVAW